MTSKACDHDYALFLPDLISEDDIPLVLRHQALLGQYVCLRCVGCE